MKILLLIDGLEIGGAETHVMTLAGALAQAGNEVWILSAGGALEKEVATHGVHCLHFPESPHCVTGFLRCLFFLRRFLRQTFFDVLHAHTRRTALMLRLLPRRQSLRALPPDFDPLLQKTYRRRRILRRLTPLRVVTAHAMFAPRFRRLSYWGEVTIAVSDDIRRHLCDRLDCHRSVHVIPNGISTDAPRRTREPSVFSVVFASRLDRDCSHAAFALLRIAPRLYREAETCGRSLRLTFLGGGACRAALQKAAEETLAAGNLPKESISLCGAVSRPQSYFADAHVFVGVSRAALEAIGCGCAVVLAGNEGYGGCLTADDFPRYAQSNFCCRGDGEIDDEKLLNDLLSLLHLSAEALQARADRLFRCVRRSCDIALTAARTQRLYVRALAKKRRLHLLCTGYFGKQNLGDESILRCLLRQLSGATAPASLSLPPKAPSSPTRALLHQNHARGGNTDYHARREVQRSCGAPFPAFGACYRGLRKHGAIAPSPHPIARQVPLRLQVSVLCYRPERGERGDRYCGVAAVPRHRILRVLWSLWKSDALLLGGGSLLQNASRHGKLSLLYYLSLPFFSRLLGCPFSLRANGIGPLHGRSWQWLCGHLLRRAAGISLREDRSAALLIRCGVPKEALTCCPDAVSLWAQWQERRLPLPVRQGYVCICPRQAGDEALRHLLALAAEHGADLPRIYVAMDASEDVAPCRRLARMAPGKVMTLHSERAALLLLHGADAVISMRLHALILAAPGIPTFAVPTAATRDKMAGVALLRDLTDKSLP